MKCLLNICVSELLMCTGRFDILSDEVNTDLDIRHKNRGSGDLIIFDLMPELTGRASLRCIQAFLCHGISRLGDSSLAVSDGLAHGAITTA